MNPGSARRLPWVALGGIFAVALVVRVVAFRAHAPLLFAGSDNAWYEAMARSIARGDWGRLPAVGGGDALSVRFPPAYPAVLGTGQRILFWVEPVTAHQWTSSLLGAAAAALTAALAWRIGDRARRRARMSLTATAGLLLACNPLVVGASTSLMAEALVLPVAAAVLLVADRVIVGQATRWDAVGLGVLLALGALTRGEALVVLGAVVVAGAVLARAGEREHARRRLAPWLVALGIGAGVVALWSGAVSIVAERPVLVSTNSGSLLLGANCPLARTGEYLGYWNGDCVARSGERLSSETAARVAAQTAAYEANPFRFPPVVGVAAEAEQSSAQTRTARTQIADDLAGTVGAVPARLARGLGVFWTASQTYQEGFEGRDTTWEQRGRWFHLVLVLPWAALAIVAVGWRRSRAGAALRAVGAVRRLVPSLAVLGTWCVVTMATYGSARFRTTVEPSLAVLAALGIVTAATVITARVRGQAGRSEVAS